VRKPPVLPGETGGFFVSAFDFVVKRIEHVCELHHDIRVWNFEEADCIPPPLIGAEPCLIEPGIKNPDMWNAKRKDFGHLRFHPGHAVFRRQDFDPEERRLTKNAAMNPPDCRSYIGHAKAVRGELNPQFGKDVNPEDMALIAEQSGQSHLYAGVVGFAPIAFDQFAVGVLALDFVDCREVFFHRDQRTDCHPDKGTAKLLFGFASARSAAGGRRDSGRPAGSRPLNLKATP
jgi:hypothetical protein